MKIKEFKKFTEIVNPKSEYLFPKVVIEYDWRAYIPDFKTVKSDEIKIHVDYSNDFNSSIDDSEISSISFLVNLKDVNLEDTKFQSCVLYINSMLSNFDDLIEVEIFGNDFNTFQLSNSPKVNSDSERIIEFYKNYNDSEKIEFNSLIDDFNLKDYLQSIKQINCKINPNTI